MSFQVVADESGLRDLESVWRALWLRSGALVPFQSPDWTLPWWSCFGTGRPIVAVAPDGLLACYLLGDKLLPIGAGITDYQDVLLAGNAASAATLLALVLDAAKAAGARAFHFTDLSPGAALRSVAPPPGWRDELITTDPCPVLTLPPGASDLRAAVGASRARDVRQARHRAERAGGVEIADENFDAFAALHAARWQDGGVLGDPRVRAFHQAAAPMLMSVGLLRIAVLRIGGVPAAACYVLVSPSRLYLYLSGFDPAFGFCSPGTILLGYVIEAALRAGMSEVHFLRGDEPYKHAWGAVARMNATRAFFPP